MVLPTLTQGLILLHDVTHSCHPGREVQTHLAKISLLSRSEPPPPLKIAQGHEIESRDYTPKAESMRVTGSMLSDSWMVILLG